MAPFNKRQVGYIQAIAGRQQHTTLICDALDDQLDSTAAISAKRNPIHGLRKCRIGASDSVTGDLPDDKDAKSLLLYTWHLANPELGWDARAVHNNAELTAADFTDLRDTNVAMGNSTNLECFNAPCAMNTYAGTGINDAVTGVADDVENPRTISSVERATQDGFLNSTDVKFRFTLPTDTAGQLGSSTNPMGTDHYEFRWIVWRAKRHQLPGKAKDGGDVTNMEAIRDGASFRSPCYDLFMGQTGRKRGFAGYTLNPNLDKDSQTTDAPSEQYSGKYYNGTTLVNGEKTVMAPSGEELFTVDDLMTMRINRDDYVVMKDVRFFLGKEHGKSHFEDHLHWDWNDPIDTPEKDVLSSPTLNDKNYRWKMTLLGTTGGDNKVVLNYSIRWTTKMESG